MQTPRAIGAVYREEIPAESDLTQDANQNPATTESTVSELETFPSIGPFADSLTLLETNHQASLLAASFSAIGLSEGGESSFQVGVGSVLTAPVGLPVELDEAESVEQRHKQAIFKALSALGSQENWPGSQARGGAPACSESKIALTGVVVWPEKLDKSVSEVLEQQSVYSKHLHRGVQEAAHGILNGEIRNLLQLWQKALQVRVTVPNTLIEDAFFLPRYDAGLSIALPSHQFSKTPITGQYSFLKERLTQHEAFKPIGPLFRLDIMGDLVELNGQTGRVLLTTFSTAYDEEKRQPNWDREGPLLEPSIFHTPSKLIPSVLLHAGRLYERAFQAADAKSFQETAARVYWWMAHGMPDRRGSAAKVEICFRAMYAARGLECPLWRPGVSADIEAMLRTEDQWLEAYPSLQWSQQEMEQAIATNTWVGSKQ